MKPEAERAASSRPDASNELQYLIHQRPTIESGIRLAEKYADKGNAFWVVTDFVEFHLMNSYYGYPNGTKLIESFESFLRSIPNTTAVARLFGDRSVFLLVFDQPQTEEDLAAFLKSCAEQFRAENRHLFPLYHMQLRCGVCPAAGGNVYEDIDRASFARDALLGQHDACVSFFTQRMMADERERDENEQAIASTLKDNEFTFYLQPKVDLATGKIVGAEALARRILPDGTVLLPESFLLPMERTGCVTELDCIILDQVCTHLEQRLRDGLDTVPIAVNLSRLHADGPHGAHRLEEIVSRHKVPRRLLSFEITETVPLDSYEQAAALIDDLRGYGYAIAGDDFGSGYNPSMLWAEMQFDVLKLDRRFLSKDEKKRQRLDALAASAVLFAKKLGIAVASEGAESADDCRRIIQWECPVAQGFYFSEPLCPSDFYRMVEDHDGYFDVSFLEMPNADVPNFDRRLSDQLTVKEILIECLKVLSKEENYSAAFNAFLERLCRYYRGDRAYIFEIDAKANEVNNTYEWCRKGVSPEIDNLQNVPLSVIDRWLELFERRTEMYINSVDEDVDKDSLEYAILEPQGISSLMAAPLYQHDAIIGFLGVDNPSRHQNDLSLLSASTDFITEELRKREMIERLEHASYTDLLTGLSNRNRYMETIRRFESTPPNSLGVVFADVNNMKKANDEHGHDYGDKLLKAAAKMLEEIGGQSVYRIGGDEFVLVFENIDEKSFNQIVDELHERVCGQTLFSISFGQAWAEGSFRLADLADEADKAMYVEKQKAHCRRTMPQS